MTGVLVAVTADHMLIATAVLLLPIVGFWAAGGERK